MKKTRIIALLVALFMLSACTTQPPIALEEEKTQAPVQAEEIVLPSEEEAIEPEPVKPVTYEYEAYESVKDSRTVYIAPTGKRYHDRSTCAGQNAMAMDLDEVDHYYTPCRKCVHD